MTFCAPGPVLAQWKQSFHPVEAEAGTEGRPVALALHKEDIA